MNTINYSTPEIQETICFLQELGLPALPVAPIQLDERYWKRNKTTGEVIRDKNGKPVLLFTGKNPSFLNEQGKPRLISHKKYQSTMPTDMEMKLWFDNPSNGVGTLGGLQDLIFIDWDTKHFESQQDFKAQFDAWIGKHPDLKTGWMEISHSGGYRVVVKVKTLPTFTNFSLTPSGKHVGEAIGEGRFSVLAPTIGPSGNAYEVIKRTKPVEVESLESIGIYPSKKEKEKEEKYPPRPQLVTCDDPNAVRLEDLACFQVKQLLKETPKGFVTDRSLELTKVIRELHGWANFLADKDIPYSGDVIQLTERAGIHLDLDSEKIKRIYDSVDETECQPAIIKYEGEEGAWLQIFRHSKKPILRKAREKHHLRERVVELFKRRKKKFVEGVERLQQSKRLSDKDCRSVELVEPVLSKHVQFQEPFLLADFLPPSIANPLQEVAEAMPASPEMLVTTLLPTVGSLIGTAATVSPWDGWKEPSVIWTMNIAKTGSMKTQTMKVITEPLRELEKQKADKDKSRDYIVSDFTLEALMWVHSLNPRGLLVDRDELDGLLKSFDKYRKGDDLQNFLSFNSGGAVKLHRKTDKERITLSKTGISITGSIQPEILTSQFKEENIHNGFFARWLYCYPEMPSGKYTGKKTPDVSALLQGLYSKLTRIPDQSGFTFSEEAKDYFVQNWHDPLVDRCEAEPNDFMQGVLAKWKGYAARLALLLHCIEGVCQSDTSTNLAPEISLETLKKALKLSAYYLEQAERLYRFSVSKSSKVNDVWSTMKGISKGNWIDARTASQKTKKVKGTDNIRKVFQEMANDGFGELRGEGKQIEWRYVDSKDVGSTFLQIPKIVTA